MPQIANGETGASVRAKLNALLPQTALASGAILNSLLVSIHSADGSRTDTITLGQLASFLGGNVTPALSALTTSSTNFTAATAFSTTISGKTSGSAIAATSSDGTPLTVSATTLTGTFPTAGAPTISLVETLSGATGSPRTTTIGVTVVATATLGTLTLATLSATANSAWSSTITGKTSGSAVTATSADGTALTVASGTVSGTFAAAGSKAITLTETLAGATGSPKTSTATVTVAAAAVTAFTMPARYAPYVDDFSTPGPIAGRANWTPNANGGNATYTVEQGYMHATERYKGGVQGFGPSLTDFVGSITLSVGTPGTWQYAQESPWDRNSQNPVLWHYGTDDQNRLQLQAAPIGSDNTKAAPFSYRIVAKKNGSDYNIGTTDLPSAQFPGISDWASLDGKRLDVQMVNNRLRIGIDGRWFSSLGGVGDRAWPYETLPVTTVNNGVDPAKASGLFGMTAGTFLYGIAKGFSVRPFDVSVEYVASFGTRASITDTAGTSPAWGFYADAAPTSWGQRNIDWATETLISPTDATKSNPLTVTTATFGDSAFQAWCAANIIVPPTAPNASKVWYGPVAVGAGNNRIAVGFIGQDGKYHESVSRQSAVGDEIVHYGQSTSLGMMNQVSANNTPSQGAFTRAVGTPGNNSNFFAGNNYNEYVSDFTPSSTISARDLARTLSACIPKVGGRSVPVAVSVLGRGATGIDLLMPSNDPTAIWNSYALADKMGPGGLAPYRRGPVTAMCWEQGEADADGGSSPVNQASKLATLIAGARSTFNSPNMFMFLQPLGRYGATGYAGGSSLDQNNAAREVLRQQYLKLTAGSGDGLSDARVFFGASWLGCSHVIGDGSTDSYHYGPAGYTELNRRLGYTIAKRVYGYTGGGGEGPIPASMTRSGATLTIPSDMNGAASLTEANYSTGTASTPQANSVKGYQVSADDFATLLPINSVVGSGMSIVITLASAPSGPVKVRSFYGLNYDDSVLIVGTGYADGRAPIPVFPIIKPLVA